MVRIILVRHGETAWNKEGKFQGRLDIELSDAGRRQAKKLAEALRDVHIDKFYSSPLKRSLETAEHIAEWHSKPVVTAEEFNEINHGSWEGMHLDAVIDAHGELYDTWLNNPHEAKMPGGEELEDIRARAVRKLTEILENTPDGSTILIAAHDATNKVLLCYVLGLDNSHFWQIKQGNASVSIIEYENGEFRITLLNDTCHLGGVLDETTTGAL
jgi:broad specificity phosphatase PhoE